MKMNTLIIKVPDDNYGWIEYVEFMIESYAVEENYTRQTDGISWDGVVKQAKKKYGKENVRVKQVDISSNSKDLAAYNIELAEKLDLNKHTVAKV